jgi:hypothetical protein
MSVRNLVPALSRPLLLGVLLPPALLPGAFARRAPAAEPARPAPPAARATGPIPRVEVKRTTGPITIDGKPDEAAWTKATPLPFVFPWAEQGGAKQATTARLVWDDRALYVAYDCDDADVVAHHGRQDDPTYEDDAVEIFINPDPRQSFYVGLEMNARATMYDYFFAFPRALIKRWDLTGAQLATSVRGTLNQTGDKDKGWSLEVAIPWSNLGDLTKSTPPAPGTVWTANLNRWDGTAPKRRLSQWSDSGLPTPNPHKPERFGELVFAE